MIKTRTIASRRCPASVLVKAVRGKMTETGAATAAVTPVAIAAMDLTPGVIQAAGTAAARRAETVGAVVVQVPIRAIEAMVASGAKRRHRATSPGRSGLLAHPAIVRAQTVGLSRSGAIACRAAHVTTSMT